jgi:serine/threonine-protein phosphatase 2B regulatory subunit
MGHKQTRHVGGRLSHDDLARLQRRFTRLSGGSGRVSIGQIQGMVELGANPFIPRMFQMFDKDKDGLLSLEEFTQALELFGRLEDVEEQYKFAFQIYDVDEDGLISSQELYHTLQGLVGVHYTEAQLEQIVLNTMAEFDLDGDNSLNLEEFKMLLSSNDLQSKFALSL